jgi:hypothetical protein
VEALFLGRFGFLITPAKVREESVKDFVCGRVEFVVLTGGLELLDEFHGMKKPARGGLGEYEVLRRGESLREGGFAQGGVIGRVILVVRLQSSPPAKIAKLRNTMTCPAMSLQHPIKSKCSHSVRIQVPIGESMMAAGAMNTHAHHGTEDEQLDGEERLIGRLSWFRSFALAVA